MSQNCQQSLPPAAFLIIVDHLFDFKICLIQTKCEQPFTFGNIGFLVTCNVKSSSHHGGNAHKNNHPTDEPNNSPDSQWLLDVETTTTKVFTTITAGAQGGKSCCS